MNPKTRLGRAGKREFPAALGVLIGAVPVHRIHELDPYQPGRARQIVEPLRLHQVINAALIGHLRSPTQPVTLNEVRQPQPRHTDARRSRYRPGRHTKAAAPNGDARGITDGDAEHPNSGIPSADFARALVAVVCWVTACRSSMSGASLRAG
jgi:hypothetical protein